MEDTTTPEQEKIERLEIANAAMAAWLQQITQALDADPKVLWHLPHDKMHTLYETTRIWA